MRRRIQACVIIGLLLSFAASCGPLRAHSAISQAKDEIYKAELAGANKACENKRCKTKAQVNYHSAVKMLEKSKEFEGFSEFDAAEFFALKAAKLAKEAVQMLEAYKNRTVKECIPPGMPR